MFQYTSKDKKITGQRNSLGSLGSSALPSSQNLDTGISTYGRLSRPQLAANSGRTVNGSLVMGTPRVTTGATTYAGVDPSSVQLDLFSKKGEAALKQVVDARNARANTANDAAKKQNDLAKLIDGYNQALASFRSDLNFGNPDEVPGYDPNSFNYTGYSGYYNNKNVRDNLVSATSAMTDAMRDYQVPEDASPEFKLWAETIKKKGSPDTWGTDGLKGYMDSLVGKGVMDSRFNPDFGFANYQDATYYDTQPTYADYNFSGVGLSGRLSPLGLRVNSQNESTPIPGGIGYLNTPGITAAKPQYNPWLDTVINNYWDFDFGAAPDAPYIKSGYGGRFKGGKFGDAPQQFSSRDLSGELTPYQQTEAWIGELPLDAVGDNSRELFNRPAQLPVSAYNPQELQEPTLTGGYSTSLRSTAGLSPALTYERYKLGAIPSGVSPQFVTNNAGGIWSADEIGGDAGLEFSGNNVLIRKGAGGQILSSVPRDQFRFVYGSYQ